jgi:hypothetical protein
LRAHPEILAVWDFCHCRPTRQGIG